MEAAIPIGEQKEQNQLIINKSYKLELNKDKYLLTIEIYSDETLILQLEKINEISFYYYKKKYTYEELMDALILHKKYYKNISKIYNFIDTAITKNKLSLIKQENELKILLKKNQEFDEIDCYLNLDEIEITKDEMLKRLFNEIKQIKLEGISNNKDIKINKKNEEIEEKINSLKTENEEIKNKITKIKSKNKELKKN